MNNVNAEPQGLDGVAVQGLLQGAVLRGIDPNTILHKAAIPESVYGSPVETIGGSDLVRLVRAIQYSLDDVYLGFLQQGCRMALERERLLSFLPCSTFGEALRVSIRFTDAMSTDVGPWISEEHGPGLQHICKYTTVDGVDRDIFVWIRFLWIFHLFSWLLGRPLALRGVSVRGRKPEQKNGFDRFAIFGCAITYNAPVDALSYDLSDLGVRLVHSSLQEYEDYYSSAPDWFAAFEQSMSWRERTQQVLIELQRSGLWSAPIEVVAARLRTRPRRLRHDLAGEGESFQQIRTRLRGELASAYLLASGLPVTAIGLELGFSEPGSFTRQFIAWAGESPSAYRAAYITDVDKVTEATAILNERRID